MGIEGLVKGCNENGWLKMPAGSARSMVSLWMKGQKYLTSVTRQRMPYALQTIKLWTGGGFQWKRVRIFSTLPVLLFYALFSLFLGSHGYLPVLKCWLKN